VFWLVWYVALSAGYQRYAVPLLVLCCLFEAVLLRDVVCGFRSSLRSVALVGIGAVLACGVAFQLLTLVQSTDQSAVQMGAFISQTVEPQFSVESLEWELDTLTDRRFHHPPPFVPAVPYSVPGTTEYLVDGPASKATQLYVGELASQAYQHLATFGAYDLYRRAD
jgi:hypothetical protein